jgi:integrase
MVRKLGGSENYSYNFRWTIKHKDGTADEHFRVRQCARVSNKKDALLVEGAHKAALARGDVHPNDPWPPPKDAAPPTLRAFAADFLSHVKTNKTKGTHRFYSGGLGRLLAFSGLADAPLDAITVETVDRYSRYRLEVAKNSSVTVNGDLRTLRRALKLGVKLGRVKAVAAVAVNEIPEAPRTRRAVTPKDEQLYLRHASANLRDAAIVACDSGLRPEELLPLQWGNVDLLSRPETPNGVIHVRGEGKSAAAIRSVPLTPRAQDAMQRRWKAAEVEARKSPFVFPGSGKTGHISSVQHPHEQAIEQAKLRPFEFYCWRHTFGSRCAMAGMDKFSLCQLMGHSSPAVTEKYYVHVTQPHVSKGFEKFVEYSERGTAEGLAAAFPQASDAVQ